MQVCPLESVMWMPEPPSIIHGLERLLSVTEVKG